MNKRHIFTLILVSLISFTAFAQKQSKTEKADESFYAKQYTIAIDLYKKAYADVKLNRQERDRILFQESECYRLMDNKPQAMKVYERLITAKYYETQPRIFLYLADMQRFNSQWDEAETNYKEYLKLVPNDELAKRRLNSIALAKEWINNPKKYDIKNEKNVNTEWNDWSPQFISSDNTDQLMFTSSRSLDKNSMRDVWTGEYLSNIFTTQKLKTGELSEATLFNEVAINTDDANDGELVITQSGKQKNYYFSRCNIMKNKELNCAIYSRPIEEAKKSKSKKVSTSANKTTVNKGKKDTKDDKNSAANSQFVKLDLGDTIYNYLHPAVSSDELTIYFSSNKPGGVGDYDLWKATRASVNEPFSNVTNLGKFINTEGKEEFPVLRGDNRLYFSSDGLEGMGGFDLFYTEQQGGEWSDPVNMGYPINSPYDEVGIIFNKKTEGTIADEESGYFSSNRKGGIGGDDIYSFIKNPLSFTLKGRVKDDASMQPVEGAKIKLIGSDNTQVEVRTDRKGDYAFDAKQIKYNVNYTIQVAQVDYMNNEEKESTVGLKTSKDFILNFTLKPMTKEPIVLPEIRYDLGKWDLKDEYQDSLSDLLVVLVNNPSFVIELGSHTDTRPFPKITNDTLSQHRAESVVDFLFARGIDRGRMVAHGYGDRIPRTLTHNTESHYNGKIYMFPKGVTLTDEYINKLKTKNEKEAAHQLNRRTEFRILRTDYIPAELIDSLEDASLKQPIVDMTKGNKPLPVTVVPIIYNDNDIPLSMIDGRKALVYIILNGANVPAVYDERYRDVAVLDWDVAMNFILTGRITKNDFKDKDKAFDKDGNILDNSVLTFSTAAIGRHETTKYEVLVKKGMKQKMIVSKNGILPFGAFHLDKGTSTLIFE